MSIIPVYIHRNHSKMPTKRNMGRTYRW